MVLHPALIAIYPVLSLYAQNLIMTEPGQVVGPIALFVGAAVVLQLVLRLDSGNRHKAGIVVSLLVFLVLSYGHVFKTEPLMGQGLEPWAAARQQYMPLLTYAGIFLIGAFVTLRTRRNLAPLTSVLNVIAIVLVLLPSIEIGRFYAGGGHGAGAMSNVSEAYAVTWEDLDVELPAAYQGPMPDILYFLMDGYGRSDSLRKYIGADTRDFVRELEARGFVVPESSRANYMQTYLSVASSLNFDYLDRLSEIAGRDSTDRAPLVTLTRNNRIVGLLQDKGYRFVAFSTPFPATDFKTADRYVRPPWVLSDFHSTLWETTIFAGLDKLTPSGRLYDMWRGWMMYSFENVPSELGADRPTFLFAHVLATHPPFVFDASGGEVQPSRPFSWWDGEGYLWRGGTPEEYRRGYAGQVRYINRQLLKMVDRIQGNTKRPTVIILQGDHGSKLNWTAAGHGTQMQEVFPILNAYYFPGVDREVRPHADITPVNSFRWMLNQYFGTDLPMLPDESFFSIWDLPYRFKDVTPEVAEAIAPLEEPGTVLTIWKDGRAGELRTVPGP